jgi:hypothetical protein
MFQGIVSRPYPEHNFNGQIMLKRVSKLVETKKVSYSKSFSDSYHVTNLLKKDEWKFTCTFDEKTTIHNVVDDIQHIYGLADDVCANLCFSYKSHSKRGKKTINRILLDDEKEDRLLIGNRVVLDENGVSRRLTIDDLVLHVMTPKGAEVERDATCDTNFMLDSVHDVGESIRSSMHWLDRNTQPIILFMDNAGGHGTNDAKMEYVRILKENYNIIVEWQVPNSPETNLLDLGFWATHQALVERTHRLKRMEADALARSVRDVFHSIGSDKILRIYERWEYVLELIIRGEGTNDLVEMNRGLTKSLANLPDVARYYPDLQ